MARPTFIIVPGALHSPVHFEPLAQALKSHGYEVVSLTLPSTIAENADIPEDSLADVAVIRQATIQQLDAGKNVVVVSHSYGGIPATSALEGLDPQARRDAGQESSVVGICGMTTYLLPAGKGMADVQEVWPTPGALLQPPPAAVFYGDLPDDDAAKWAALLKPTSTGALRDHSRYSAHEKIPVHYLLCTEDQALPYAIQQKIVKLLGETGGNIRTEEVASSHSPFLSQVEKTTAFLRRSAGEQLPA